MVMRETELYLEPEGAFATHYDGAGERCVVIAPPLFEELARTRKLLVNLARDLAACGIDAIRFDYPGTGLSAGATGTLTLDGARGALAAAVDLARQHGARRVDLVGFRFGGYLVLRDAIARGAEHVLVWEPMLDPAAYLQELLRIEMSNQVVTFGQVRTPRDRLVAALAAGNDVVLDGNWISAALYRGLVEAPAIDLAKLPHALAGRLDVIAWDSRKLYDTARSAGLRSVLVPDVQVSWRNIRRLEPRAASLFDATLAVLTHTSQQQPRNAQARA